MSPINRPAKSRQVTRMAESQLECSCQPACHDVLAAVRAELRALCLPLELCEDAESARTCCVTVVDDRTKVLCRVPVDRLWPRRLRPERKSAFVIRSRVARSKLRVPRFDVSWLHAEESLTALADITSFALTTTPSPSPRYATQVMGGLKLVTPSSCLVTTSGNSFSVSFKEKEHGTI